MITKEIVMIGGKEFMYRVSDKGVKLELDGELYDDAYDPIPLAYEREYTETEEPIEGEDTEGWYEVKAPEEGEDTDTATDADYQAALTDLGVNFDEENDVE